MKSKSSLSTKILLMVEVILLISGTLFCMVSIYRARVGIRKAIQQFLTTYRESSEQPPGPGPVSRRFSWAASAKGLISLLKEKYPDQHN